MDPGPAPGTPLSLWITGKTGEAGAVRVAARSATAGVEGGDIERAKLTEYTPLVAYITSVVLALFATGSSVVGSVDA